MLPFFPKRTGVFLLTLKWTVVSLWVLAIYSSKYSYSAESIEVENANGKKPQTQLAKDSASSAVRQDETPSADYQIQIQEYEIAPLDLSDRAVITLDEALLLATRKSYGYRLAKQSFDKSLYSLPLALSQFRPELSVSAGIASSQRSGTATLAQSSFVSQTKQTFLNFDVSQSFPTGQSFSITNRLSRNEVSLSGAEAQRIPRSYSDVLGFQFVQPLGRGLGRKSAYRGVLSAEESIGLESFRLADTERELRYQTYSLYYQLVAQRKALLVREANFEAARKLLERNYERFKVGLAIRADVLQAENNVLNQKLRLVEAQRTFLKGLDDLALLLGISGPINIEAETSIEPPALSLDPKADWEKVRANSREIAELETNLRLLEIEREFRLSELRTDANLAFTYSRQGERESVGSTLRNLDNESYSLTLNYRLPIGKTAYKARLGEVEKDIESTKTQLEQKYQQLRQDWENAFLELESKRTQLELAKSSVEVARENYEIQVERNKVGLAQTLDVVLAQEALLEAELSFVSAQVDYQSVYRRILRMAGLI